MAADDTRPTAVAIRSYMRNSGWRESTQGTVGSVWTKGDAKFCVPHEGDDPDLIQRALVRLASAEGRTPEETAAAIAEYKAAPLVMPADEFAAVRTVAEACGQPEAISETGWRAIADDLAEAIRLTREYVEPEVALPSAPGWSWHDAMCRYREAVSASAVTSPAPAPGESPGAAKEPAGRVHRPGPRRMVARQVAPSDCLACGQRWPCRGSWQARAGRAEARLSAVAEYVRSRPSWITDPVESRLRKDAILAIIGSAEEADCG